VKGTGFLLRESLADEHVLEHLSGARVTEQEVLDATDAADWQPREWHGVAFEVDLNVTDEDSAAQALQRAMHPNWYLNFDTPTTRYVIFSDQLFKAPRADPAALRAASEAAKAHGRTLAVPETQLDGC